jgi:hypothetical protein
MTEIRSSDYFAIVPEYVLYADISSNAVRLFAILNRFANSNLRAWPSRKTLADAMRVSPATIDRAKDELVAIGAMTVERRFSDAGDPTSNIYTLRMGNSAPVRKGTSTRGDTGIPTGDDLNRARVKQSQLGKSPYAKSHASQAAHVASLARLGRDDQIDDYVAGHDPAVREYLYAVRDSIARPEIHNTEHE